MEIQSGRDAFRRNTLSRAESSSPSSRREEEIDSGEFSTTSNDEIGDEIGDEGRPGAKRW